MLIDDLEALYQHLVFYVLVSKKININLILKVKISFSFTQIMGFFVEFVENNFLNLCKPIVYSRKDVRDRGFNY